MTQPPEPYGHRPDQQPWPDVAETAIMPPITDDPPAGWADAPTRAWSPGHPSPQPWQQPWQHGHPGSPPPVHPAPGQPAPGQPAAPGGAPSGGLPPHGGGWTAEPGAPEWAAAQHPQHGGPLPTGGWAAEPTYPAAPAHPGPGAEWRPDAFPAASAPGPAQSGDPRPGHYGGLNASPADQAPAAPPGSGWPQAPYDAVSAEQGRYDAGGPGQTPYDAAGSHRRPDPAADQAPGWEPGRTPATAPAAAPATDGSGAPRSRRRRAAAARDDWPAAPGGDAQAAAGRQAPGEQQYGAGHQAAWQQPAQQAAESWQAGPQQQAGPQAEESERPIALSGVLFRDEPGAAAGPAAPQGFGPAGPAAGTAAPAGFPPPAPFGAGTQGAPAAPAPAAAGPNSSAARRALGGSPIIDPGLEPAALTAGLALLLGFAAMAPRPLLAVVGAALQAVTAAGWFRLNGMWPARQGIALAALGGFTADAAALALSGGSAMAALAGTLGGFFALVLVLQLVRPADPAERFTALTVTASATVMTVFAGGWLAAYGLHASGAVVTVGAFASGTAVLVAAGARLGASAAMVAGFVAALVVGGAAGALTGLGGAGGLAVGAVAGACALVGRRVAAYDYPSRFVHLTAGVAVPLAVAAPAVYLLGLLVG